MRKSADVAQALNQARKPVGGNGGNEFATRVVISAAILHGFGTSQWNPEASEAVRCSERRGRRDHVRTGISTKAGTKSVGLRQQRLLRPQRRRDPEAAIFGAGPRTLPPLQQTVCAKPSSPAGVHSGVIAWVDANPEGKGAAPLTSYSARAFSICPTSSKAAPRLYLHASYKLMPVRSPSSQNLVGSQRQQAGT